MLKDALATHKCIAMALATGEVDEGGLPRIASVAGVGFIVEQRPLPDGRSNILLHGRARVRLEELPFVPPYRRALATVLEDVAIRVPEVDRAALRAAEAAFVAEVAKRDPKFGFSLPPSLEPGAVADLCAHHLIVDARVRQSILEELDVTERVRLVTAELVSQQSALLHERGSGNN
jgi:ATP-dependent Lon protease